MVGNAAGELEEFSVTVNLDGCKAWHNVQVAFTEFKNAKNFALKDFDAVAAFKVESASLFAINNVLLI